MRQQSERVGLIAPANRLLMQGEDVDFRPLRRRSGFHTFDRWLYNATVSADPPRADLVLGVDLDGFL